MTEQPFLIAGGGIGGFAAALALARSLWADLLAVRTAHVDSRKHEIAHAVLAVAILWFCWLLVPLVIKDYRNFGTGHFDTGIFDQAAYLLAHGEQFMSGRGLNVFGHHANFGLYLFAPFYWVGWGSPALLDSAMVVSLGTAAVPVYLIARDRTESVAVGLVVAVAYLLHFSVSSTINEGFHPESMAVLPLFAAFLFADRGQWKRFAVAVVYAVCWKEDIALFVAMLGVYLFFAKDRRAVLCCSHLSASPGVCSRGCNVLRQRLRRAWRLRPRGCGERHPV